MMTHSQWLSVIFIFGMLIDVGTSSNDWIITVNQRVFTVENKSNITISCTVQFPLPKTTNNTIQAFWLKNGNGPKMCEKTQTSKDFIFHPNNALVIKSFQGRTKLLRKIEDKDCSLLIDNIQSTDAGQYYLRVETGSLFYSFCHNMITIKVIGHTSNITEREKIQGTENPVVTTVQGTSAPSVDISIFIYVPIILLAVVITIVIVLLLRRRKRRRYPTRQDSSYYVNFNPPGEMQQNGPKLTEKFEKEQEPPPCTPTPKDEPIYSNFQGKPLEEPSGSDQMDNIYSNIGSGLQL